MDKETRDRALQHIPYGLYVVGSADDRNTMTIIANWAMQVSFAPPLLGIAIEADSRIRELIENSGFFALNMLPAGKTDLARIFLKPKESPAGVGSEGTHSISKNGMPLLHDALASLECHVISAYLVGDHMLFLGEVIDAVVREGAGDEVLTLRETGWRYQR